MKQDTKARRVAAQLMAAALSVLLLFSLSGCSFFGPKEERTEWIVDGEYDPLDEEQTAAKLMGYIQAGDADSIYQVFSQTAKDNSNNLREKIEELIAFVNDEMVSWEYDIGGPFDSTFQDNKIMRNRMIEFFIQTEKTRYVCILRDVMQDEFNPDNEGFYSITVFPEELSRLCDYGSFEEGELGVFLSYQGETNEEGILENLLDLAESKDNSGIYNLFSEYAKENVPDLPGQIETLIDFLGKPIRSWEFEDCATEWVQLPGTDGKLLRRMTVFSLHTDEETYTLQIRDLINGSENGENLGLYSVAVHTEQYTGNCLDLGWRTPGIFIYQLTITPSTTQVQGGGVVWFTTSIEATVTSDTNDIVPKQIDALTWEVTLPADSPYTCGFTAMRGEEEVYCSVLNNK
ncbi:DUF5104 domain-containing protein [Pseudoflavonifractor phocaeensis]|uniref:DUF5104 domain-containing protein n=1 Tax=Pseudoflavonifractor phocaeensis TaxID=1870988 RepID=UPI0019597ACA|nr:DUF5104 domain-containing protein [Pseudoflavonifractor phocaeensis]